MLKKFEIFSRESQSVDLLHTFNFVFFLLQVSESIASNGFLPSGSYDDSEDKPMLIMKKSAEGHSLTALINRQLQGTI